MQPHLSVVEERLVVVSYLWRGVDSLGLKNIIFELDDNKLVDNLNVSIKLASKFGFSYNIVRIYLALGQIVWLNM